MMQYEEERRKIRKEVPEHELSRRVYPKVSGLTSWSENCKWYSFLPLGTVVSLLYESV
jgi:hypothetical protein